MPSKISSRPFVLVRTAAIDASKYASHAKRSALRFKPRRSRSVSGKKTSPTIAEGTRPSFNPATTRWGASSQSSSSQPSRSIAPTGRSLVRTSSAKAPSASCQASVAVNTTEPPRASACSISRSCAIHASADSASTPAASSSRPAKSSINAAAALLGKRPRVSVVRNSAKAASASSTSGNNAACARAAASVGGRWFAPN